MNTYLNVQLIKVLNVLKGIKIYLKGGATIKAIYSIYSYVVHFSACLLIISRFKIANRYIGS